MSSGLSSAKNAPLRAGNFRGGVIPAQPFLARSAPENRPIPAGLCRLSQSACAVLTSGAADSGEILRNRRRRPARADITALRRTRRIRTSHIGRKRRSLPLWRRGEFPKFPVSACSAYNSRTFFLTQIAPAVNTLRRFVAHIARHAPIPALAFLTRFVACNVAAPSPPRILTAMAGSGERWRPAAVNALPRMRSRIPFRPSVFSALLIAALLAAAALIADTARADHFTGTGQFRDSNFGFRDTAPFGVMCITLGGTRRACGDRDYAYLSYVCDMREATITTYVDGKKYNGCRTDYVIGADGEDTDFITDYIPNTCYSRDANINAIGPIPRCHDAFPECPEGAAYKSTYIFDGETLGNPLSGCVCPGGKIAGGGGCVCPSGLRLRP